MCTDIEKQDGIIKTPTKSTMSVLHSFHCLLFVVQNSSHLKDIEMQFLKNYELFYLTLDHLPLDKSKPEVSS